MSDSLSGLLTAEQSGQMMLLQAVVNDDAKMKRIQDILDAQAEVEKRLEKLRDQEETNRALLKQAQDQAAENAKVAANDEAKRRELAKKESDVGEVIAALNAEKAAFEEVRRTVEAQQNDRDKALKDREVHLGAREDAIAGLMKRNTQRDAELNDLEDRLNSAIAMLKKAMSELEPHD